MPRPGSCATPVDQSTFGFYIMRLHAEAVGRLTRNRSLDEESPFSMVKPLNLQMHIRGKPSNLYKLVFELRYQYGYTYLDRCGKTINAIMRACPEWVLKGEQATPQGTALVSLANQSLFNFSSLKMDFGIEQSATGQLARSEVEQFLTQVDLLTVIVIDQLGLKEFTRIGLRAWYLFPSPSKEDAESWIQNLGVMKISESITSEFEGQVESVGISLVLAGTDRKYRIGLNGVEKSAMIDLGSEIMAVRTSALTQDKDRLPKGQNRRVYSPPSFGVMIDIDCYQEDPISIEPRDFVETSLSQGLSRFGAAVNPPRS